MLVCNLPVGISYWATRVFMIIMTFLCRTVKQEFLHSKVVKVLCNFSWLSTLSKNISFIFCRRLCNKYPRICIHHAEDRMTSVDPLHDIYVQLISSIKQERREQFAYKQLAGPVYSVGRPYYICKNLGTLTNVKVQTNDLNCTLYQVPVPGTWYQQVPGTRYLTRYHGPSTMYSYTEPLGPSSQGPRLQSHRPYHHSCTLTGTIPGTGQQTGVRRAQQPIFMAREGLDTIFYGAGGSQSTINCDSRPSRSWCFASLRGPYCVVP